MTVGTRDPIGARVSVGSRVSPGLSGPSRAQSRWGSWPVLLGLGLLLSMLVRVFLVETFFVPDEGMGPTLAAGDRVLLTKVSRAPRAGDVVVVDVNESFSGPTRETPLNQGSVGSLLSGVARGLGVHHGTRSVVARVAAVGGDVVTCAPTGELLVRGEPVSGDVGCQGLEVHVPSGYLWVLGDNPAVAVDSLSEVGAPTKGLVRERDVVGRVVARWWPLSAVDAVGESR